MKYIYIGCNKSNMCVFTLLSLKNGTFLGLERKYKLVLKNLFLEAANSVGI